MAAQPQAVNVSVAVGQVAAGEAVPATVSFDLPPQVNISGFQLEVVSANATPVLFSSPDCLVCQQEDVGFIVTSAPNSNTIVGFSTSKCRYETCFSAAWKLMRVASSTRFVNRTLASSHIGWMLVD